MLFKLQYCHKVISFSRPLSDMSTPMILFNSVAVITICRLVLTDGVLGHEALMLVQHLTDRLSTGGGKSYNQVLAWIKVHLAFAII